MRRILRTGTGLQGGRRRRKHALSRLGRGDAKTGVVTRPAGVAAVVVAVLVAGCASAPPQPGTLQVTAHWAPWEADPLPHLLVALSHEAGGFVVVGPTGDPVRITGPDGAVPLEWSSSAGRSLGPGDAVVLALHPRAQNGEGLVLSVDHGWGEPREPPPGPYVVCVDDACAHAVLHG